jgi:VWFA-related protein
MFQGRRLVGVLIPLGLLAGAAGLSARQDPFRAGADVVTVPVTVFDRFGELATRLTAGDFRLIDDGEERAIVSFAGGHQPVSVVLLLDTSLSMTLRLDRARFLAEQLILRLRPGDLARAGVFNTRVTVSPAFTDDRDALLRALGPDQTFAKPTRLFDALNEALSYFPATGGRRVVVAITDGCDTASRLRWPTLRQRFLVSDVMIYILRVRAPFQLARPPRGSGGSDCIRHALLETSPAVSLAEFFDIADDRRRLTSHQFLNDMTSETGGGYVALVDEEDVNLLAAAITAELHAYYLLGFNLVRRDGRAHDLEVRTSDPTLAVRARRRYLAPSR